jgi:Ni/Co efflux regulator RcnB
MEPNPPRPTQRPTLIANRIRWRYHALFHEVLSTLTVAAVLSTGVAFAQHPDDHSDHHDDRNNQSDRHDGYVRHDEWHKGARINHDDWNRGAQVDWRAHHLQAPRRGYEWRQVDGNYVLAAAATGIIAATILAAGH